MKFLRRRQKLIARDKIFLPTKRQIIIPFKPISVLLIIFLFIACFYLIFRSDLFLIRRLEIGGVSCIDKLSIQNSVGILGTSYFAIDSGQIESKLKKQFLCLAKINVQKIWPDRVTLQIEERQPLAIIKVIPQEASSSAKMKTLESTPAATAAALPAQTSPSLFLVDEEGVLFSQVATTNNLPVLLFSSPQVFKIGDRLNQGQIKNTLLILSALKEMGLLAETVRLSTGGDIQISLSGGSEIILPDTKDPQYLIDSLQLIIRQAKIEGKGWRKIDLRFDKPVVVY